MRVIEGSKERDNVWSLWWPFFCSKEGKGISRHPLCARHTGGTLMASYLILCPGVSVPIAQMRKLKPGWRDSLT